MDETIPIILPKALSFIKTLFSPSTPLKEDTKLWLAKGPLPLICCVYHKLFVISL